MGAPVNLLQAFGLSTASGLNAYVPLLVVGLLARYTGLIHLNPPYDVLTHAAVLVVLALVAALDFIADKVPAVDHALHVAGLVIHPVAGAVLFLAASSEAGAVHPALAAVCGLLLAGGAHAARMGVRPLSTAATGGVGNPVLSFLEDLVSLMLSVLAVVVPVLAVLFLLLSVVLLFLFLRRWRRGGRPSQATRSEAG